MNNLTKFLSYFFGISLILLCGFLEDNFGKPGIEQILFHLNFENAEHGDSTLIWKALRECVLIPIAIAFILTKLESYYKKSYNFHFVILVYAIIYFCWDLSVIKFIQNRLSDDSKEYIAKNYVDPKKVKIIQKNDPKNLVLIYVESMENTYADEKLFGKNLIQDIENLNSISFKEYHQAPGTDWTTAGVVASQCGMPMKVIALFSMQENLKEGYYPQLTCLGNILKDNGYKNIFMGGASLSFGRKGRFLATHGYDEIYGREEWLKLDANQSMLNEWGVYDDYIFEKAKKRLLELHKSKELFNLTLLTIEMHYPKGYISPTCKARGVENYEDIIECASYQLKDFVDFARKNGVLENTNIVILGDHLSPISLTKTRLPAKETRTIFNSFISNNNYEKNREEILHFDIFPSILEFLGFEVKGGKLGLGYSGFSKDVDPSKLKKAEEVREKLLPREDRYNQFLKTVVPGHVELNDNF